MYGRPDVKNKKKKIDDESRSPSISEPCIDLLHFEDGTWRPGGIVAGPQKKCSRQAAVLAAAAPAETARC